MRHIDFKAKTDEHLFLLFLFGSKMNSIFVWLCVKSVLIKKQQNTTTILFVAKCNKTQLANWLPKWAVYAKIKCFLRRTLLVHFKQIELVGFKSFADRLQIKFDSGITAIVGPNGCGKSNVADAIRWVLGEQSSKQLRGSSMQDVIFNGTKKRKSLSYCEATLTFNNQDRFFDLDYDEIDVTRKLYRSGESEYLINKQPVRLKDIINLFYDSGIGRDGYSIIGQGKVEEIISSKPETRRLIFEEAAGIAKYKSRKVEAERKLERTRDNLTRLRDIIYELERQLGPLKKQAEVAKKYLELKAELKDLEINAYIYQYENASDTKNKISARLNAIAEELALRETEYSAVDQDYEECMSNIDGIDGKMEQLHQNILSLTVEIEKQSSEARIIKERIAYLEEQNTRAEYDIENGQKVIGALQETLTQKEQRAQEIEKQLEQLFDNSAKLSQSLAQVASQLDFLESQAAQATKSIIDSVEKITDIKTTVSALKTEREILLASSQEFAQKFDALAQKFAELEKAKQEILGFLQTSKNQSEEFAKAGAMLQFKLQSLADSLKAAENNKTNLFAKLQVYENRKRLLTEMQAEFEGYAHSVKKLLKESERNAGLKSKMVGVLANLIKVPQKFENAIEVALGAAVQNIVTYNEQGAKDLIEHLKTNQYGRATFLPITTMKPRTLTSHELAISKMQGSFGVASNLISFPNNIRNVVENLLGATIVVENLDVAIAMANKTDYGVKIVTLGGDVINPQGSFTGGSRKNDSVNLIAREREIETLAREIEKIKIELEQATQTAKDTAQEIKQIEKQIQENNASKSQADILLAKENQKLSSIEQSVALANAEKLEIQNKQVATQLKLENIEKQLDALMQLEQGSISTTDYTEQDKQRIEKLNSLRAERDGFSASITSIKVEIASLQTELQSLKQDTQRITQDIANQQVHLQANKNMLEKNTQTIEQAKQILEQTVQTEVNQKLLEQLQKAKQEQFDLSSSKQKLQADLKTLNDKRNILLENISSLREKRYGQEMQLSKVDTDIQTMQERIYEEYQLDYNACLPFKKPDFDANLGTSEINRLRREINKLGYVNVNAIEDSKEVLARYEMMAAQEADLVKAEDDLKQIIAELSKEMEVKFKTKFDKINENFKITFRELFGGGSASLELLDDQNILESGVEIIAEPPGKNLKSITLLSGGEKALTAIAILFAILRMRPMPFCLLDEIEAALDEANVQRFAQYLRKFAQTTQFIVITHRKPTMELADALYGVTMEEEGVSTIVSVLLSDALKNSKEGEAS
jgi:chromosome segregation protein